MKIKSTGCCEPFDPEPWQNKTVIWKNKIFVKSHVASFLHIPLNMGKVIIKNMGLIEKAKAKPSYQLMLTDEKSLWGADIYIDVIKNFIFPTPLAQNAPKSTEKTTWFFLA